MTAATITLEMEQGATFSKVWTCRDAAGAAIDLSAYTARMQVRATYASSAVLLDCSTANGKIVLGGAAGTIALTIPAADLAALTIPDSPGKPPMLNAVFDLELVNGGTVIRLLQGPCNISREVTRA